MLLLKNTKIVLLKHCVKIEKIFVKKFSVQNISVKNLFQIIKNNTCN